jgi:hypothetical protein
MIPKKDLADMDLTELLDAGFSIFDPDEVGFVPDEPEALLPDRVVRLGKQCTRAQAYARFAEIAKLEGLVLMSVRETAKFYLFECLYDLDGEEV